MLLGTFNKSIAAALTVCVLSVSSAAFALSVSTPPSYVNGVGQTVSANASFTFKNKELVVQVQNLTEAPRYFTQTLSGMSFKIKNYHGDPFLQTSRGNVRVIMNDGTPGNPSAEITNWTFEFKDGVFTLAAPGRNYTILPETSSNDYYNADSSLLSNGQRPFITGSVSFLINIPGMPTDEQIEEVQFKFSDTGEDMAPISGDVGRGGTPSFGGDGAGTPALSGSTSAGGTSWAPINFAPQTVNPGYSNSPSGGSPSSGGGTGGNNNGYSNPNNRGLPVVVPEAATLAILGVGALAMLRRKAR